MTLAFRCDDGCMASARSPGPCAGLPPQLRALERLANDRIVAQVPVSVFVSEDAVHDPRIRRRRLPADLAGPIRVVEIEGLDQNLCCGTHVTNLGQLQVAAGGLPPAPRRSLVLVGLEGAAVADNRWDRFFLFDGVHCFSQWAG